ncbi:hypothetical protein GH714_017078 [Hevea brasiliensis]|uniref:Uncharacterized protein n=1 Tax=Hevea brasiliensis TaxID=3981 RepID=A0A6A6K6Q7_HEVBR|nr:hypothetical protein GH714_017078 [Hevea brasiliensis]
MGLKGFVEGGIASIVAGCSTHPLDLIKVRMQLQGETHAPNPAAVQTLRPAIAFHTTTPGTTIHLPQQPLPVPAPRVGPIAVGVRIVQQEGVAALFSGVSATMLRQTLYSTTRMGLYDILKQKWTDPNTKTMPLASKIAAGLIAGGIGAAVGNPADVAMVRMQADGRLPPAQRAATTRAQPGYAGDSIAASIIRPIQGNDPGKKIDARWTWNPRDSKFRGGIRGIGSIKSSGRDKDKGDEHEGGSRGGATVCRGVRLRNKDCEGGGSDGAVQRFYTNDFETRPFHDCTVCDTGTGQEAVQGFLMTTKKELNIASLNVGI